MPNLNLGLAALGFQKRCSYSVDRALDSVISCPRVTQFLTDGSKVDAWHGNQKVIENFSFSAVPLLETVCITATQQCLSCVLLFQTLQCEEKQNKPNVLVVRAKSIEYTRRRCYNVLVCHFHKTHM